MRPLTALRPPPVPTELGPDQRFKCQRGQRSYNCYGPAQIRVAYGIQPLLDAGRDGSGRTIAIVDAFQNPTIADDLKSFDNAFLLPAPPGLQIIAPFGLTPFDPTNANQVGWSSEIALDVEWAHAVAPGAGILLALSPSASDADLINTEAYVVQHRLADVISMSFGEGEQCMPANLRQQEHSLYEAATAAGITLVAAAGDQGAAQYCTDPNALFRGVSIPASDPNVTAVGGTNLVADVDTGAYGSESVWNEGSNAAGGGGFSSLYSRPTFQQGSVGGSMRGVPDVSYDASAGNGVVVAWGSSGTNGKYWVFSGTSSGTPQWAAIFAIADQVAGRDLGNVNPALYAIGGGGGITAFHDVTVGNNNSGNISGYTASAGWDPASGLGSPIASALVASLGG